MKKFTLSLLLIFALGITSVMAQGRTVSGKITDSGNGAPIIGATVIVQGTSNGAYSLDGGEFIISNVEGAVNLEVTFMGYTTKVIPISASQTKADVKLVLSAMQMDEIVVIAYGTADKKSLTGSVAVISSEDMELRPITNATSAIAGMSPGISATTASGVPGESASIRIRGEGSINSSSDPLYVVDGIPYPGDIADISPDDIASMSILKDAASTALYGSRASNGVVMIQTKSGRAGKVQFNVSIKQGFMYSALPMYERVGAEDWYELSWEAKRNALYHSGSTLQEAGEEASEKAFNTATGYSWFNILTNNEAGTRMPNEDVFQIQSWGDGSDWTRGALNADARVMDGYKDDLDWVDYGSGVGYRQNYNISASGGTEKTSYFTSIGYTDEDGYFANTSYSRLNARVKVDVTPTKWLKMGTNLSTSLTDSQNPYAYGGGGNPWIFSRGMSPIYPIHEHNYLTGEYILDGYGNKKYDTGNLILDNAGQIIIPKRGQNQNKHIFMQGELDKQSNVGLNLVGQAYATITFLKDFKFTVDGSINQNFNYYDVFKNSQVGDNVNSNGYSSNEAFRNISGTYKQMLEWGRSFDKHRVDIIAGHESYLLQMHRLNAVKTGEIFPGSQELDNFATTSSVVGNADQYSSEGYLGRFNYNYDEKYYLSASYRRDGSSKFSPENRWGNFWSIGASWIVTSEEFMSNVMWVDFLKVRASYGTNGNDGGFRSSTAVGLYAWQSTYSTGQLIGEAVLAKGIPGTPNLMWETAGALDVGIEFGLLNRVNGSIGYYEKSSNELIFSVPVPLSAGITTETQNVGSMVNRGVELSLNVDVIRKKDWLWNVGMNMAWQQNRITKLPDHVAESGIIEANSYLYPRKMMVGYSRWTWYMYQYAGVDSQDGETYYHRDPENISTEDFQKDGQWYTKSTANALKDLSGDGLSPITGAINTSLTWKDITLSALFSFRVGGKALNQSYTSLMSSAGSQAMSTDLLNSWRKPGDVAELPRLGYYIETSNSLIDNSYIALQNLTVAYKFPKKVANKLALSGLSIYATGENLFQISAMKGYDAMSSTNGYTDDRRFSSVATVSFGVNISF